jgi:hypothetical protein
MLGVALSDPNSGRCSHNVQLIFPGADAAAACGSTVKKTLMRHPSIGRSSGLLALSAQVASLEEEAEAAQTPAVGLATRRRADLGVSGKWA